MPEWRKIDGFPGYEVSSLGAVRSNKRGKWGVLLPSRGNKQGRAIVTLYRGGAQSYRLVSRLVCAAFHGPAPEGFPFACHANGDCTNDRADNLAWGSPQSNMDDRDKPGRTQKGETHYAAKMDSGRVREIRRLYEEWKKERKYGSGPSFLAKKFGVPVCRVESIVYGRKWRST